MSQKMVLFSMGQVLFFALMWTSKTAHILFFEASGSMINFGASYMAMALVGYGSFFVGHLADRFGFRKVLISGAILYASGLILRAYPQSLTIAILSGLLAGAGASSVLCALRLWMLDLSTEENLARLIGWKSATCSFGTALGCITAGALPIVLGPQSESLRFLLTGSAVGILILAVLFYLFSPGEKIHSVTEVTETAKLPQTSVLSLLKSSKALFFMALFLGTTTGFYVSFISPYLPLIMKDKGLSLLSIGLSTGSLALIRFFVDPRTAKFIEQNKAKSLSIFLTAEISITLITGGFLWSYSKESFLLLLVLRSALLGLSSISEEVLWIQTFPKQTLGLLFGLNQTGFFFGDFIGGALNSVLYKTEGLDSCIFVVLTIMVINAVLFYTFFRNHRARLMEISVSALPKAK